jgi:hypothetical protein
MKASAYRMVLPGVVAIKYSDASYQPRYDRENLLTAIENVKKSTDFARETARQEWLDSLTGALAFMDAQESK